MVVQDSWLSSEEAEEAEFLDELKPGMQLMHGQYTIQEFLNSGGFGITYLASDSLDRTVVIKECFPGSFCRRSNTSVHPRSRAHQAELRSIVRLFAQEARSLAKVGHPNIVGVHNVFEDNNTAYMALDFVKGRDLLELIEDEDIKLTPKQVTGYLEKLLDAIGFVHKSGLLHRDISPDNIIIREDGEPVLIDFGAAREQASKASRVLSALRVVKDGYSPQEFYISGSEQSPSCDLYSLAASFYHIITGDLPPDSQTRLSAYAAGDKDPYVPLAERAVDHDRRFCAALDKAMSVLPRERVQSAEEWLKLMRGEVETQAPVMPRKPVVAANRPVGNIREEGVKATGSSVKMLPLLLGTTGLVAAAGAGLMFFSANTETLPAADPVGVTIAAAPAVVEEVPAANSVEPETRGERRVRPVAPLPEIDTSGVIDALMQTDTAAVPAGDTLPEAAELIVPEADVAALLRSELTAAALSDGVELMAPTGDTAAPEALASGLVPNPVFLASMWSVQMPFTPGTDDPRMVGELVTTMYPWLEPGQVIEQINGMDVMSIDAIPAMLRQSTEVGGMSYIEATMSIRAPGASEAIERSMMLPVTQIVALKNDVRFLTIFEGDAWVTEVQDIPNAEMTTLEVNDRIVGIVETGQVLADRMDFTRMVEDLRRSGANEITFDVIRDGAPATAGIMFEKPEAAETAEGPAAAVTETAAAPVAEQLGTPEAATEAAAVGTGPLDVAPVMSDIRIVLPFEADPSQPGVLSGVTADAPFWMADGLRVLSVNDRSITSLDEIEPLVMQALAPGAAKAEITFGIAGRLNDFVTERTLTAAVMHDIYLLNGLGFRAERDGEAWVTKVTQAPAGSELQVGDVVKANVNTNQLIDGPETLRALIESEMAGGSNSLTLAVERDGSIWVKSFVLASL